MLLTLVAWAIFGLIAGALGKMLYGFFLPDANIDGWFQTIVLGIIGSYCGGLLHYLISGGFSPIQSTGIVYSVLGVAVILYVRHYVKSKGLIS